MQRVTLLVEPRREVAVTQAPADGRGAGLGVEGHGVEVVHGELVRGAVGDGVEGVSAAQGAKLVRGLDDLLRLFDRLGRVEAVGVVGEIAGPVGAMGGLCIGRGQAG